VFPSTIARHVKCYEDSTAVCCSVLQCVGSVLHCAAVCCSSLQCIAVCLHARIRVTKSVTKTLCPQCVTRHAKKSCCWPLKESSCQLTTWCVAVCCSVLQCVAVCCSVLQCVDVLQCIAVC